MFSVWLQLMQTGRHNTLDCWWEPNEQISRTVFVKVPWGICAFHVFWTATTTMSDISINISFSNDPPPQRTVTEKRKRINRRFRKKQQHFRQERNNRTHGHSGQSSYDQNPLHNGEASKHPPLFSLPHADTITSASHCSSRPSKPTCTLPSWTPTVNTKGNHEKSKESVKTKSATTNPGPSASSSHKVAPTKYLAIDCEMVGTGPKGSISQLARCSIVSYEGDVVYDKFIKPSVPVTDYRTRWSGIRYSDLIKATPYSQARKEVRK